MKHADERQRDLQKCLSYTLNIKWYHLQRVIQLSDKTQEYIDKKWHHII